VSDSEQDQAAETLLGYAGRRASRELVAAVLFAPFLHSGSLTKSPQELCQELRAALDWADVLIELSAENPRKTT
jgi:hypothetical protein